MQSWGRTGQDHQAAHRPPVVQVDDHTIPVGLAYFIHSGPDHRFQLLFYLVQKSAVKWHRDHFLLVWVWMVQGAGSKL